jgi:hypothetical protein
MLVTRLRVARESTFFSSSYGSVQKADCPSFVNTYYDVNAEEAYLPKHTPGVLTCAMYSKCVGATLDSMSNFGGEHS